MPLPCPVSLVEKNGSNMRSMTCGGMPGPVSRTNSSTKRPFTFCRQEAQTAWMRAGGFRPMRIAPVPRMASRALMHRLSTTCSTCTGSISITGRPSSRLRRRSMVEGSVERSSLQASRTSSGSATGRRAPRCPRLKVSIWPISSRARCAECCARSRYLPRRASASSDWRSAASARLPRIPCRMLLKSCAMPPVRWPIASIFCAWRSWSSSCSRSASARLRGEMSRPM